MKCKKGKQYMTTRAQYKDAKKYDHQQFDLFCTNIYTEGFTDGASSVQGVDVNDVMDAIKTVNGIGEKRLGDIRAAIDILFK